MDNILDWLASRLKEKSTYVGLASVAAAIGLSPEQWQAVSGVIVAIVGAVAIFTQSKKEV